MRATPLEAYLILIGTGMLIWFVTEDDEMLTKRLHLIVCRILRKCPDVSPTFHVPCDAGRHPHPWHYNRHQEVMWENTEWKD